MLGLYIYTFIFILILICSSIAFIIFSKKAKNAQKNFKQKIYLYTICSTLIISGFATIYCISLLFGSDEKILTISRPNIGEGDTTISVNVDSDIYSGTIDLDVQEKTISFEEAIEIFSKYREDLDKFILGDNSSFCEVTDSLNFLSNIGEENIAISWYISNPEIIDYTGAIIYENLLLDSTDVEIIATLKLGEHTADICYSITVVKTTPTAKEELSQYLNNQINDSSLLEKKEIDLPSHINGINLSFYNKTNSLPPIYFYIGDNRISYTHFLS